MKAPLPLPYTVTLFINVIIANAHYVHICIIRRLMPCVNVWYLSYSQGTGLVTRESTRPVAQKLSMRAFRTNRDFYPKPNAIPITSLFTVCACVWYKIKTKKGITVTTLFSFSRCLQLSTQVLLRVVTPRYAARLMGLNICIPATQKAWLAAHVGEVEHWEVVCWKGTNKPPSAHNRTITISAIVTATVRQGLYDVLKFEFYENLSN